MAHTGCAAKEVFGIRVTKSIQRAVSPRPVTMPIIYLSGKLGAMKLAKCVPKGILLNIVQIGSM
jgi:hypothetical protein